MGGGLTPLLLYFRINWINVYRKLTNVAQNVKKVASKNLKKPKVAENSKKMMEISKVAEKLPSNLWLSHASAVFGFFFNVWISNCLPLSIFCASTWVSSATTKLVSGNIARVDNGEMICFPHPFHAKWHSFLLEKRSFSFRYPAPCLCVLSCVLYSRSNGISRKNHSLFLYIQGNARYCPVV